MFLLHMLLEAKLFDEMVSFLMKSQLPVIATVPFQQVCCTLQNYCLFFSLQLCIWYCKQSPVIILVEHVVALNYWEVG